MWALGALLAIFGSVATNFGVNVQKYSQNKNAQLPKLQQQFYYKQKLYLIGLALVILGSFGDFAALSMAAQSIVAPLGSVTLVTNIIFAKYFLKEILSRKDLYGTIGIIVGSVISVAFGDHSDVTYTVQQLTSFYVRPLFIVFAIITALLAMSGFVFVRYCNPLKQRIIDSFDRYDYLVRVQDAQLSGSITDDIAHESIVTDEDIDYQNSIIECLELDYKRYERLHPFVLCALSGVMGGYSVMFGKMVAECLSTTFAGNSQLGQPVLYLFALCMLFTIMSQLNFLAIALGYFDALYCVPIFQVFWIMTSTFGGACYFNEFNRFTGVQWILFPLGIVITITGVVVLSTRNMTQRSSETHGKHNSAIPHELGELDTLDEVDEMDDEEENITDEDKLKHKLQLIQQNALYAANALDNPVEYSSTNQPIELTNVSIDINSIQQQMKNKINELQQCNDQYDNCETKQSTDDTSTTIHQSSITPTNRQLTPTRNQSLTSTPTTDYSPNSRIRQIQQDSIRSHRRSRSGSGSPNYRRSIDLDSVNAPDTPLHRALSYFAGAYSGAVGAVHASDYIVPTNSIIDQNDDKQDNRHTNPLTPNSQLQTKSFDSMNDDNIA